MVIDNEKKILTYQNELALLMAIYELNNNKFNKKSEDLNEKSIFAVLNRGEIISKSEVIRDFDGWSWNIMTNEIDNYIANLVYQCMVYLLGSNKLNQNKNMNLKDLEIMLKERYKPLLVDKILKILAQVSILNYINENPDEQQVLKDIQKQMEKTYSLMEDKKTYIEKITNQKKKYLKEIEKIDKYINDDLELKREYIKQNEKLPQDKRVFSLSDFSEQVQEKRDFLENEIKNLTENLKPKNYVKEKSKIEKKLNFIKELNVESPNEIVREFINIVLKAINIQITNINLKKEIVQEIHILRYLKLINIDDNKIAGDICKKQFEKVEKNLITKGCNIKALNIFSQDVEENYIIYKNIFNTKIIDLESAYIKIDNENNVIIYDENSIEKKEKYNNLKELTVKYNKKIKIFL